MNEVALSYEENDLLIFFQQVRLQKAKDLADVKANRGFENKQGASFSDTINNFGRFLQRNLKSADKVKETANRELDRFKLKNEKVVTKEEVVNELDRLFEVDKYGLAKLVFAVSIILDNEYSYEYLEEGLSEASNILYGNPNTMLEIKSQLEDNYRSLSLTNFTSMEKGALVGVGCIALIFAPILTLAASAVGVLALNEVIKQNKEKIKEEFKNSTSEMNSFYLALQLTYIQRLRKVAANDEFKEELDSVLKHIEELKSDLDDYLYVERENTKDNKEKTQSFNAFDKRLLKILELDK